MHIGCGYAYHTTRHVSVTPNFFLLFSILCYDASGLRQGYKKDTAGISEAPFLSYFGILGGILPLFLVCYRFYF